MTAKTARQEAIARNIKRRRPRTQQELADILAAEGHDATQATISRDIAEMGVEKTNGGYLLVEEARLVRLLKDLVTGIESAGNLVVVKSLPGGAQGVAAAIDAAGVGQTLGSIAGDDTILVIARDEEHAARFIEGLEAYRRM